MDVVAGFLGLILLLDVFAGLIGFGILSLVYSIFRWIKNPSIKLAIVSVGMVLGWLFTLHLDASTMLILSLFLGVPMAVLVPLVLQPVQEKPRISLLRVLPCYLLVWVVSAGFPFVYIGSEIGMIPFFYWHTPLSNAILYGVLMLLDIGIAGIAFRVLGLKPSLNPTQEI